MVLPHNPEFRFRTVLFWALTITSLAISGVFYRMTLANYIRDIGITAVISAALYELTFLKAALPSLLNNHHETFTIPFFYLASTAALFALLAGPWLVESSPAIGLNQSDYWFCIPCFLSMAAGAYRALREAP